MSRGISSFAPNPHRNNPAKFPAALLVTTLHCCHGNPWIWHSNTGGNTNKPVEAKWAKMRLNNDTYIIIIFKHGILKAEMCNMCTVCIYDHYTVATHLKAHHSIECLSISWKYSSSSPELRGSDLFQQDKAQSELRADTLWQGLNGDTRVFCLAPWPQP